MGDLTDICNAVPPIFVLSLLRIIPFPQCPAYSLFCIFGDIRYCDKQRCELTKMVNRVNEISIKNKEHIRTLFAEIFKFKVDYE